MTPDIFADQGKIAKTRAEKIRYEAKKSAINSIPYMPPRGKAGATIWF